MKKLILLLAVLMVVVLLLLGGAFWALNRYVESPEFKQKLVDEISRASGGTVRIEAVSVSLINRIELGGIRLDRGSPESGSQLFSTKKFLVKFNIWSLLHKQFEIEEIVLDSPDIKIVSKPKNEPISAPSYQGEAPPVGEQDEPPAAAAPGETLPGAEPTGQPATDASPAATKSASQPGGLELVLKKARVIHGRMDITLPNGKRVLLENFDFEASFESLSKPMKMKGTAHAVQALLTDKLPLSDVEMSFHLDDELLTLDKVTGRAFEGDVSGNGQFRLEGSQPFLLNLVWEKWSLKTLLAAKPEAAQAVTGTVSGDGALEGDFESPLDLTGNGHAVLHDTMITVPEIKLLVWAIQIPNLQTIDLTQGEVDFRIANRRIDLTRIDAVSSDVKLTGTGWIGFDDAIDFNLHPSISGRIHTKIPNEIAVALKEEPDKFYGMNVHIWNTVQDPKNDFAERIGEDALRNAATTLIPQGALNGTFDQLEQMLKNGGKPPADDATPPAETPAGESTNTAPSSASPKKSPLDLIDQLLK